MGNIVSALITMPNKESQFPCCFLNISHLINYIAETNAETSLRKTGNNLVDASKRYGILY